MIFKQLFCIQNIKWYYIRFCLQRLTFFFFWLSFKMTRRTSLISEPMNWLYIYIIVCQVYGVFREWSVPLVRGFAMSFQDSSSASGPPLALRSHLWLSIAVACNGGHTLGNGFGELAKQGEGNRRVSNPRWVWIGQCQLYCMRNLTPGRTSGRVHLKSQRLWRRWQLVLLERLEQVLAVSRRNGSSCPWIKTSQVERVGLSPCTGLLIIKLSRTGQFCNSSRHHWIRWTTTTTFHYKHGTFSKPNSIPMSWLYILTSYIRVSSYSFFANSLISSMYIRWLIFSCDLLSLYPAVHF